MDPIHPVPGAGGDQLGGSVTEDELDIVADIDDLALRGRGPDGVRDVGDERAVFAFAGAESLLRLFARRDVLDDGLKFEGVAAFEKEAADSDLLPGDAAVRGD